MRSQKELIDFMRFRHMSHDIKGLMESASSLPAQAIFNPGGGESSLQKQSQLPPNFSGSSIPCTLDQQNLIEYLSVLSGNIFTTRFSFVCLPTTPLDECWEVFAAAMTYDNLVNPQNAVPALFLIAKGAALPTGNDGAGFFPDSFGIPNGGVPLNTISLSKVVLATQIVEVNDGILINIMPDNLKSIIIPPGWTLMLWDGSMGGNPNGTNVGIELRVAVKREKYNTVPAVHFQG